jgi:hypothetical protein
MHPMPLGQFPDRQTFQPSIPADLLEDFDS